MNNFFDQCIFKIKTKTWFRKAWGISQYILNHYHPTKFQSQSNTIVTY
jgi:hypothetical protein